MRFIHTADWHLGKFFKNQSLIEDQQYILKKFLEIVDEQKVDAIIIAGDIYDRNIPTEDAVNLFDWVLNELILERNLHVLCIAGNHDSEVRLNFGNKLFENTNFHIRAKLQDVNEPVILNDEYGEIYFSLIPYFDPPRVKAAFKNEEEKSEDDDEKNLTYDEACQILVEYARSKIPDNSRSIAVTHAFIVGGKESGSERKLPGGLIPVKPAHFQKYNYTALGHLHGSTQTNSKVRYSGSLLKYSFDEWKQNKSLTLVEIDGDGNLNINNNFPLIPLHEVRVIKGAVRDILENESESDDYISVQYEGIMFQNQNNQLRQKFKNLLEIKPIDRVLSRTVENARQRENKSNVEKFTNFYQDTTGKNMTGEELAVITNLIEEMERGN